MKSFQHFKRILESNQHSYNLNKNNNDSRMKSENSAWINEQMLIDENICLCLNKFSLRQYNF